MSKIINELQMEIKLTYMSNLSYPFPTTLLHVNGFPCQFSDLQASYITICTPIDKILYISGNVLTSKMGATAEKPCVIIQFIFRFIV